MIQAKINGQLYEMLSSFTISEQLGNKTSSDISVKVGEDQPIPKAGDIVEIVDADGMGTTYETYFFGVAGIPKSPKYRSLGDPKIYSITLGNANSLLSRRLVNIAAKKMTVTQIVHQLFDDYISDEGIELVKISDMEVTFDTYTAADMNLQTALDELASYVQGIWTIEMVGEKRCFCFFAEGDFPKGVTIDEDLLIGAELQHTTKDTTLRTVQIVKGAMEETDVQTEVFKYEPVSDDDDTWNIVLQFPVAEKPKAILFNILGSLDKPEKFENYQIGQKGLNEQDEACIFFFEPNSNIITYKKPKENVQLFGGEQIQIQYIGLYPIRVSLRNQSKITEIAQRTGTSGLIEEAVLDTTVNTSTDAALLAETLLKNHGETRGELTFWSPVENLQRFGLELDDLKLLTKIRFDLPSIGVVGDYVITERSLSPFKAITDDYDGFKSNLRADFKLVDRDYLKSYADLLNEYKKESAGLSVRPNETVLDAYTFNEAVTGIENFWISGHIPIFCTSNADFLKNGQVTSSVCLTFNDDFTNAIPYCQ